jgi:hypothetical protein
MWLKNWRSGDRPITPFGALLVVETEAFLAGGFAQHARLPGNPVPNCSWLNVFAYGDLSSLEELRSSLGERETPAIDDEERSWETAQRLLVDELLELVKGDAALLIRIQQRALVPLELQLLCTEAERALTARGLVQATRTALRSSIA